MGHCQALENHIKEGNISRMDRNGRREGEINGSVTDGGEKWKHKEMRPSELDCFHENKARESL